jgi:hypothetical protein
MSSKNVFLLVLLAGFLTALLVTGLIVDGPAGALRGFAALQVQPGRLINDFFHVVGIGGTLINAALAGAAALVLILLNKVQLSGPTYAAVFTIVGFGLFGKTPVNIIPIFFGVYLASLAAKKKFQEYIIIALFGTALGPIVSFIVFESGLTGAAAVIIGIVGGTFTGFLLPAIAVSMLHLHQGYNLYNLGLSCGFLALFAASLIRAAGHTFAVSMLWYTDPSPVLIWMIPILSLFLIISGLISGGKKVFQELLDIQKISGRLPSDFMDMSSTASSLINSGLIGLAGSIYVFAVGGDFNGPVIGGLLTIMGFGAFGTHLKNSWPVVLGIIISTLVFGQELSAPGPILAALFGTTLAPLAGQFGIFTGMLAGFIHLFMVLQTGAWQGGINLYNNGFAGGLTATLLVAVIQWVRSTKDDF